MVSTAKTPVKKAKTYQVITPLHHDGELYQAGESIALTPDEAAELLMVGCVGEKKVTPAAKAPAKATAKPEADAQGSADK